MKEVGDKGKSGYLLDISGFYWVLQEINSPHGEGGKRLEPKHLKRGTIRSSFSHFSNTYTHTAISYLL